MKPKKQQACIDQKQERASRRRPLKPRKLSPELEERLARLRSVRGKYAHLKTSSDDFMRRKQEEIELEG